MTGDQVFFSVVVPTYNRPEHLRLCLEALASLDYPRRRYEVVVVDDGGTAPVAPLVKRLKPEVDLRLIRQANAGPASARNAGARAARGRYLAFTDDDCRPAPDWLGTLEARLEREPGVMVGGPTANLLPDDLCATASQAILDMVYGFFNPSTQSARFLASNNMALPASGFAAMDGFDTSYRWPGAEDRDLCDRWTHAGRTIRFVPEARIGHAHPMRLTGFCRQHFTYGRGAWLYHQCRARRGSGKMSQDLRFNLQLHRLLGGALWPLDPGQRLAVVAMLGVWQAANAAGFLYQMAQGWTAETRCPR